MATIKTDIVTAIDAAMPPIADSVDYLGEVRQIPVSITADAADGTYTVEFSKVLPPNTKLIGLRLEHSAITGTTKTLDIGYTGDPDAIIDAAALTAAGVIDYPAEAGTATAGLGGPIDVSGKAIIGTLIGQLSSDTIKGYILVTGNI